MSITKQYIIIIALGLILYIGLSVIHYNVMRSVDRLIMNSTK